MLNFRGNAWRCLAALVLVDALFMAMYVVHELTGALPNRLVMIAWDRSVPEMYQYLKAAAAAGLAILIFRRLRQPTYLVAAGIMAFLMFDDGLSLHERLGDWFADALLLAQPAQALSVEADDLGEMLAMSGFGVAVLTALVSVHRRAAARERRFLIAFEILLAALAFCGVVMDLLPRPQLFAGVGIVATLIEDGGEMVCMSALLVLIYHHWTRHRTPHAQAERITPHPASLPRAGSPASPAASATPPAASEAGSDS